MMTMKAMIIMMDKFMQMIKDGDLVI